MKNQSRQKAATFFLVGAMMALALSYAPKAHADVDVPFDQTPQACQCFPHDAASKQYVAEGKNSDTFGAPSPVTSRVSLPTARQRS